MSSEKALVEIPMSVARCMRVKYARAPAAARRPGLRCGLRRGRRRAMELPRDNRRRCARRPRELRTPPTGGLRGWVSPSRATAPSGASWTSRAASAASPRRSCSRGGGLEGRGEDVTYAAEDHDDYPRGLCRWRGSGRFDGFSRHLGGLDLFPGRPPQQEFFRDYRRWAFESAAARPRPAAGQAEPGRGARAALSARPLRRSARGSTSSRGWRSTRDSSSSSTRHRSGTPA